MIIVKITGGLGNQMFQFALASILAKNADSKLYLEIDVFKSIQKGVTPWDFQLNIFNNQYSFLSVMDIEKLIGDAGIVKLIKKTLGVKTLTTYKEKSLNFDSNVLETTSPVYLKGYFQSYKYFRGNERFVRDLFKFDTESLKGKNIYYLSQIQSSNSVSIHIRRGDYVSNKNILEDHGICNFDYYLKAINILSSKISSFKLFFFSDDMDWVKENFSSINVDKFFIEQEQKNDWVDMFLMSSCDHQIIANSSFSWWGAWLNSNNSKIVVAPKIWNKKNNLERETLLPKSTIRV